MYRTFVGIAAAMMIAVAAAPSATHADGLIDYDDHDDFARPFVRETVVVRRAPVVGETVIIERRPIVRRTIVVERRPVVRRTVVVHRRPIINRTVVVDRHPVIRSTIVAERHRGFGRAYLDPWDD